VTPKQAQGAVFAVAWNVLFAIVGFCVVHQLHPHGWLEAGVWADVIACAGGTLFQLSRLVRAAGHAPDKK
jgi:hypothetical protein